MNALKTRRELLEAAGATALGAAVLALAGGRALAQPPLRIRKDAGTLTASSPDIVAFAAGVAEMRRRSRINPADPLGWEFQRRIHADRAQHGNWNFLPWHRLQAYYFEQIIAKLSGYPNFALPYWDWRTAPRIPSYFLDRNSALHDNSRLTDIPPSQQAAYDFARANQSVRKGPDSITVMSRSGYWQAVGHFPRGYGTIDQGGHGWVHVAVGGDGNFGFPSTATLDPIFWFHHCNVDRVWETFSASRVDADGIPHERPRAGSVSSWLENDYRLVGSNPNIRWNSAPFVDAQGRPATMRARAVLKASALGYKYDKPFGGGTFELAAAEGSDGRRVYRRKLVATSGSSLGGGRPAEQTIELSKAARRSFDKVNKRAAITATLDLEGHFTELAAASLVAYLKIEGLDLPLSPADINCFGAVMGDGDHGHGVAVSFDASQALDALRDVGGARRLTLVVEAIPAREGLAPKCAAEFSPATLSIEARL